MLKLLLIIKLNPSWSRKESVSFYSPDLFAGNILIMLKEVIIRVFELEKEKVTFFPNSLLCMTLRFDHLHCLNIRKLPQFYNKFMKIQALLL